jgi:hypothetical protein
MRFTSAKSAKNATPPHPTGSPFNRAKKNRMSGVKIASNARPCRCSGEYSAERIRSSSLIKARISSVACGTNSTVISSALSTGPSRAIVRTHY